MSSKARAAAARPMASGCDLAAQRAHRSLEPVVLRDRLCGSKSSLRYADHEFSRTRRLSPAAAGPRIAFDLAVPAVEIGQRVNSRQCSQQTWGAKSSQGDFAPDLDAEAAAQRGQPSAEGLGVAHRARSLRVASCIAQEATSLLDRDLQRGPRCLRDCRSRHRSRSRPRRDHSPSNLSRSTSYKKPTSTAAVAVPGQAVGLRILVRIDEATAADTPGTPGGGSSAVSRHGVVTALAGAFVAAVAKHRHWSRSVDGVPARSFANPVTRRPDA